MFYVSEVNNSTNEVWVTDTKDGVKECYSKKQIMEINKSIPILGMKNGLIERSYSPKAIFQYHKIKAKLAGYFNEADFDVMIIDETMVAAVRYNGTDTYIRLPYGITEIWESCFHTGILKSSTIKGVDIPPSVRGIGYEVFKKCALLGEIVLPDSVEFIEASAFNLCTGLKRVVLPNKLKTLSANLFYGCESLSRITIPASVKTIDRGCFSKCENLTEIVIPEGVEEIDVGVFFGCKSLRKAVLPRSLRKLEFDAFTDCGMLKTVVIDKDLFDRTLAFDDCGKQDIRFNFY